MKIRFGLVLAIAIGLGLTGCASGGGGAAGPGQSVGGSGGALVQGENPRDTENTRAAERALSDGADAEGAEAQAFYRQALTSAEAAIAEDGRNPLAHRLAAMAALQLEEYETAGAHFDHAAELRPLYEFDFVGIRERAWLDLYQEATPHVQSGDYEAAIPYFEGANAIYADRPEAMVTLGQIYAQLRNHEGALENIDNAMAFIESDRMAEVDSATQQSWREQVADVPLLRAQVLTDAGRLEEASSAYQELSAADPDNIELSRNYAAILMQMGNQDGAFVVYDDLMGRPGLDSETLYSIGVGFYQGSDYERAGQAFGGAAEASVNDRDAIEMWARSLLLDSAYAAVPPVAERWAALDPYGQNAHLMLAQAANQIEDLPTTQRAVAAVEALEVHVNDLQLQRFADGGAIVSGSVTNKKLDAGATVSLRFTFYTAAGDPIGTVTESVAVGGEDMAEVFQVQFDSAETVDGYGYELTVG